MRRLRMRRTLSVLVASALLLQVLAQIAVAVAPGNDVFQRTWERTEQFHPSIIT